MGIGRPPAHPIAARRYPLKWSGSPTIAAPLLRTDLQLREALIAVARVVRSGNHG